MEGYCDGCDRLAVLYRKGNLWFCVRCLRGEL